MPVLLMIDPAIGTGNPFVITNSLYVKKIWHYQFTALTL